MPDQRPRVFILEDETALAIVLEDMVVDSGCDPALTVGNLRDAERAFDNLNCDCALIDINVGGQKSFGIAREFLARGIPFAFLTGYDSSMASEFGTVPVLQKPYTQQQVQNVLAGLLKTAPTESSNRN